MVSILFQAVLLCASILPAAVLSMSSLMMKGCDLPPALWCDSPETAERCQVEYQCARSVWLPRPDAPKVKLALYYETLCPGCQDMITKAIAPTYAVLSDIMDLTLVPYGNAEEVQVGDHWKFTCQHEEDECEGNMIHTCTLNLVKNISAVLPFIVCMESSDDVPHESGPKCAKKYGIDYSAVLQCVNGPLGNKLEHEMAVLTEKLIPPHEYTPWITLNGIHTEGIEDVAIKNLRKLICDTYTGPKPAACNSPSELLSCAKNV